MSRFDVPAFVVAEARVIGQRYDRFVDRCKTDLKAGTARLRKVREVETALRAGQTVVIVPPQVAQGPRSCGCNVVGETVYPCRAHAVDASELQYGIEIDTWQRRWHTPMGQPITEESRRHARDRYGEGGFNPTRTEQRTGTSSLTPDIETALVAARNALMFTGFDDLGAIRGRALDAVNDVLKRSGYTWETRPSGPKVLVKPKASTR